MAPDPMNDPRVRALLGFPAGLHPYAKWQGAHWRLVELADLVDLGAVTPPPPAHLVRATDAVLGWLTGAEHVAAVPRIDGRYRAHASQEGNALYACSRLGLAADPRVRVLAEHLLAWQWPDGGWNCDRAREAHRSSFHETVTPALGLAAYHRATGSENAAAAARRAAELLLEHRLYRRLADGAVIHPSWVRLHYPPYWHYDIGQGLRLLAELGLLADPRAADAVDLVRRSRRRDGRFSGPTWTSARQPGAVDRGRGPDNDLLNARAEAILQAAAAATAAPAAATTRTVR